MTMQALTAGMHHMILVKGVLSPRGCLGLANLLHSFFSQLVVNAFSVTA